MSQKRACWRYAVAMPMMVMVASCAIPATAPVPAPTPVAAAPTLPPSAPPPAKTWDERRLDPGEWRYDVASRTAAFAQAGAAAPLVAMACRGDRIEIVAGLGAGAPTLDVTLKTSAGSDALRYADNRIALPSRDARLDRIAFSRGRFALEASNGSTLTLPVQSEIGRLIEDCRG